MKKRPPVQAKKRILQWTKAGCSKRGIAYRLGTSLDTFNRWLDEYPDLQAAYDEGRERERVALHNRLFREAMAGNVVAGIFLLKARHGYREGDQPDAGNRVAITFNLPGALSVEDFSRVIEHERPD